MKISIITVCLNAEATISETLYSVKSQSYQDIEHIIVDGNSSDKTLEIIKSFNHSKLKIISENDSGIYEAMNKGISISTGEYLFFLNANDKFVHNKVIEIFVEKGMKLGHDLVYGTYLELNNKTGNYSIKHQNNINKFDLSQSCPLQPTLFYKKDLFERFGLFDTDYKICADYDWSIRVLSKEKLNLKYIDTLITLFDTQGISSINNSAYKLHKKEREKILNLYFSKLELMLFNFINISGRRKWARSNPLKNLFKISSVFN